jgi:hypothetical protein
VRIFASAPSRGGGVEPELFETDVDGLPHLAFLLPLWLARSLTPGRTRVAASRITRLRRRVSVIHILALESVPETLQLKNQRGALRSDSVAARLAYRAPCVRIVIAYSVFGSHG